MPLTIGDELRFDGASGTVVAVTATTDENGRGSIVHEGATFRFRVLKAPAKGATEFPYVATDDPYFRVGLVQNGDDATLFCIVFDDLPAPLGWGRWIEQSEWKTAADLAPADAVVMTVGWRPGTITIQRGGEIQAGAYADIVLRYATSAGLHQAWFQPAYPFNDLQVDEEGVPLRGPNRLGLFQTNSEGELWRMRPDGTLEEIILARGIGALGNREQDRWASGPEPERYLTEARVYYLQEWEEIAEGAAVTLDAASCRLTITGPPNAGYEVMWEDGWQRRTSNLDGSGTATETNLVPGKYAVAVYHGSDMSQWLPRQEIVCAESGGEYTIDFGSSFSVVPEGRIQGRVYAHGAVGAAGVAVEILPFSGLPHGGVLATTDANGDFDGAWEEVGFSSGLGIRDEVRGSAWVYVPTPPPGVGFAWDPCLGGRCSVSPSWHADPDVEGATPWGCAGPHLNLPPLDRAAYIEDPDTGARYDLHPTATGHGVTSDPMPRWRWGPNWTDPTSQIAYRVYDADGTLLCSIIPPTLPAPNVGLGWSDAPPWVTHAPSHSHPEWVAYTTTGSIFLANLGGKYEGSVVEADRSREITVETLPEAARLGLEFGKWTQPLEHRSESLGENGVRHFFQTSENVSDTFSPLTFGDWECPYCGGPVWCEPTAAYVRGFCMQCADFGVSTDARSTFITQSLPAFDDWLDRVVKMRSSGFSVDRLIPGWPRPEEYDEIDDYLIDDWEGLGIPRWVAVHLVFGGWWNGVFLDGESIADAESRLNRTVGPVQLKLLLTGNYDGAGQTLRVACARPNGTSEWRTVTVPVGASAGDLFPLNWYPHDAYPKGYYTDVTAMEKLAGNGAVYALIVNDGPAWHSTVGVAIRHHAHSPYACDVALSQRDPFLVEDFAGRLHLVYLREGRVMHRTLEGTCAPWSPATDVTAQANWPRPCREPSLSPLPHGELVVAADSQGTTRLWRSEDDGERWE